jgi:hypothetical protein
MENVIIQAPYVILIYGIQASKASFGLTGIKKRQFSLQYPPGTCIICCDTLESIHFTEAWNDHILFGLNVSFEDLLTDFPFLVGRCDLVLNDYSTSKFIHAPNDIHRLVSPTGTAILQGFDERPPHIPFHPEKPLCTTTGKKIIINLMSEEHRHQIIYIPDDGSIITLSRILYNIDPNLSRNIRMVSMGRYFQLNENINTDQIPSGCIFHQVLRMGRGFIDPYLQLFTYVKHSQCEYPLSHPHRTGIEPIWYLSDCPIHIKMTNKYAC